MVVWTEEQLEAALACDGIAAYASRMRRATDAPSRRMFAVNVLARIEGLRARYGAGADGMMERYSAKWLGGAIGLAALESEAGAELNPSAAKAAAPRPFAAAREGSGRPSWAYGAASVFEGSDGAEETESAGNTALCG